MAWSGAAYFDASTGGTGVALAVAGGVSDVDRWTAFKTAWLEALRTHGAAPPFHMREFTRSRDGQFSGWSNARRGAMMADLIDCILDHVDHTCSSVVLLGDYDRVDREYRMHEEWGSAYEIAAMQVLFQVRDYRASHQPDAPFVPVVYESGDRYQGRFISMLRRLGVDERGITTATKGECVPLQAADLIAYENTKAWEDGRTGRVTEPEGLRRSFKRLDDSPHRTWGFFDERSLRNNCIDRGVRQR